MFVLSLLSLVSACARQGYPTGGPKDETPPVALGTRPANESRGFDGKEFYIQFDEYVVLKNATENVLVSPPMKEKPEFTTKGKGVLVKLKDTLQANTTYLFQFKEAIADFTEGNLLPSYEYVFSTGEAMDTLMLDGQVVDARNGKAWKESVTVMAYRVESGERRVESGEWRTESGERRVENDTMATTVQPDYVTRCDKEGNFAFHYIPEGRYRLVALEDKNRNLRVDATDPVAWDTTLVASHPQARRLAASDSIQDNLLAINAIKQSSNQAITLRLSVPESRQQRILKSEFAEAGRITIVSQLPMQNPRIEDERAQWQWRLNEKRDTLTAWCFDAKRDSARLVISDTGLQDTLKLRYTASRKGGRRVAGAKEEKAPLMKALCDGNKAYYDDLRLAFANPIVEVADSATAEVMHLKDSTVSRCAVVLDIDGIVARIMATGIKSGEQYRVRLAGGLFTDLYGNRSDSLVFTMTPKDYGTLSIDIDNCMGAPLVVEVLDSKDTVVASQALARSGNLRFLHLPSGDYRLRAVVDADSNGRWTPGDYRRQRQPEQSVLFEKTLSLREKWEMEERWTVEPPKAKTLERKTVLDSPQMLMPATPGTLPIRTSTPKGRK
ncbi:MAG: Ig-like domain-containing protein [Bacteroidales bacterium]|nr:Ig-like domain-containing protein [Bacteroidales bacterium]